MSKKDDFRAFVKARPNLASYVESNDMTWQKFYELYDLYGEDESIWDKYKDIKEESSSVKIGDIIKNVNLDKIKEHIGTAQKALSFVEELTSKTSSSSAASSVITPRPLNKFFED